MTLAFPQKFKTKNLEFGAARVALDRRGDRLAVGLATGGTDSPSLQVYDVDSGRLTSAHAAKAHICRAVAFGPDDALYFLVDGKDLRHTTLNRLSAQDGQITSLATYSSELLMDTLVCDRQGKYLAVAGRRAEIRDLATLTVVKKFSPAEPDSSLAACFSTDGKSIYIYGTTKGHIVMIDIGSGREAGRWSGPQEDGWALAVSETGKYLAALGRYKGLFVYDTTTGERIMPNKYKERSIVGHPQFIRDELMIAPPAALDLGTMMEIQLPPYPPGNIFSTAVAAEAPVIAFSHREGPLIWARLHPTSAARQAGTARQDRRGGSRTAGRTIGGPGEKRRGKAARDQRRPKR